ncbi:MAG: ABC transporter permease subunit [Candidatus Aminicenantales bacterium]
MRPSVFGKTLRDQRFAIIGGGAGIVALSFYLCYVYPFIGRAKEIVELFQKMPPFLRKFIDPSVLASPEGFFNLQPFSVLGPLVFVGYAIARGSDIVAGEEERGTLELILAGPLGRANVLLQKAAATALILAYLSAVIWAGMASGCAVFSIAINRRRLLEAAASLLLLSLAALAMTLAAGCLTGRKRASIAAVSGVMVLAYLIQAYAPMVASLRPWQKFSPFYYYNGNSVLIHGLQGSHAAVLGGLAAVFLGLSVVFFNRRDLRA